jgi:hypothetical protein
LVVENPGTWLALFQKRQNTGERLMRKTNPPAAFVQNEGNEQGGDRCVEETAGSATGARRDIPSIGVYLEAPRDAVPWEAGAGLGISNPKVIVEMSDRGAMIKLTNLGATSHFWNKYGRAGKKSSRQFLGTDMQVEGFKARALLDPGFKAELELSASFATQRGMHSQVDEETLIELADGTRVP